MGVRNKGGGRDDGLWDYVSAMGVQDKGGGSEDNPLSYRQRHEDKEGRRNDGNGPTDNGIRIQEVEERMAYNHRPYSLQ